MKVKCTINNILNLPEGKTLDKIKRYIQLSDGKLDLDVGMEYKVYGVLFRNNSPWYYLCTDSDDLSPSPYPSELFEISDARLPAYWRFSKRGVVAFEEWANDETFLERLIENDPDALKVFKSYQQI